MTSSEYKNTIQWTLAAQTPADEDTLITARRIFRNLGVAFPQGTISEVITVLDCGDYMGWNACNAEQARYCANNGYTAIGITQERVVIILPDSNEVRVRSAAPEVTHPVASEISKMSDEEISTMQFFVNAALLQKEDYIQADSADIMVVSSSNTTYDECESCQFCDTCQTMCQLSCQVCDSCQSTCETSCQSTCQIECQTCDTCQSLCQIVCQTCDTCQSVSEESNQVSVILIEPEADRTEVLTEDHTIFINAVGTNCSSIMAYVNNSLIRMEQGNSLTCLYSVNSAGTYSIYIKGIGSTGLSAYSSTNTVTVVDAEIAEGYYRIKNPNGEYLTYSSPVRIDDSVTVNANNNSDTQVWKIEGAPEDDKYHIKPAQSIILAMNIYRSGDYPCTIYTTTNNIADTSFSIEAVTNTGYYIKWKDGNETRYLTYDGTETYWVQTESPQIWTLEPTNYTPPAEGSDTDPIIISNFVDLANGANGKNLTQCGTYLSTSIPDDVQGLWCAWFVSECAKKVGLPIITSNSASSLIGVFGNYTYSTENKPKVGDIALIHNRGGGDNIQHAGIIVEVDPAKNLIRTQEGNMGNEDGSPSIVKQGEYDYDNGTNTDYGTIVAFCKNSK